MYVEHSNATNKKTILIKGKASAGIYAKLSDATGGIASGTNEGTDAVITIEKEGSAGILGEVKSTVATGTATTLTLTNSGNINVKTKNSTGMMLTNDSASLTKDKVKAENAGIITLSSITANR